MLLAMMTLTSCARNLPSEFCFLYEPIMLTESEQTLTPQSVSNKIARMNYIWKEVCHAKIQSDF